MSTSKNLESIRLSLIIVTFITCILTNFGYYTLYYASISCAVVAVGWGDFINLRIKKKLFIIIFFFFVVALFSILQRNYTDIFNFMIWFFAAILGYFSFSKLNIDSRKKIGFVFMIVIVLSSIEGLIQFFSNTITFVNYLNYWGDGLHQGTVSIYLQHIVWGHMLVLGVVVNESVNVDRFWVKNALRLLLIINLYASQSRTSWIVLLLYFVFVVIRRLKGSNRLSRKTVIKSGIFILVVMFATIILLTSGGISEFNQLYLEISNHLGRLFSGEASYRFRAVQALMNYRIAHPNIFHLLFGSGYGSTSIALADYGIFLSNTRFVVDNQIVSVFFDFGLISGVFFTYLFIDSIASFMRTKDKEFKLISALYICNFLVSLAYESFGYQVTAFVFFFVLGARLVKKNNKDAYFDT